jgi:hypothetical protein
MKARDIGHSHEFGTLGFDSISYILQKMGSSLARTCGTSVWCTTPEFLSFSLLRLLTGVIFLRCSRDSVGGSLCKIYEYFLKKDGTWLMYCFSLVCLKSATISAVGLLFISFFGMVP